ncbi:MAG: ankyrin repeat domain-containing protein, partial [Alphaproteobacteria bacterium]|nr:ankyrin repeat domain-containing protein [Alphaproteobacteria bacterium]
GNIVVPLEMKYEDGVTFIHEIGHAYDAMLFEGIGRDNKHNISLETYSIINSDSADFASLFFPNLAPSVFDNATEKLEKIIDNILDIEAIRKDIKEHIDFGYDFKIRSSRIVFNMFKKLQLAGFGSRIFDLDTFKNPEDYRFDSEKTLTKKNIARALYIVCAYMRKGIEGNAYKYLSDGKFFSFGENESAESIWDGTMEMLTMIGVVPYVIDGRTFVINDKQNEFIAAKRSQIVEKDIESEQDLNVYRFHLLEHDKKVLDSLKVALSDIKMRGDVDEQSLKDIDHIEQPSEMMHLSTEYVENEMAFVNSEQAAQLLMKKNNEIRDEGAYSDYAGLNPASFSYSQRSSDFKHNCISNAQVSEGALELAVLRKDIPGIIQALQKTTDLTVIRGKGGNHWMSDILCGATPERTTVLHLAVANGDFEVVKTILDHIHTKIDDVLDSDGRTPLHFAVMTGNWDITKLLLERGATDKFDAINMRASECKYWHRQFSLPRLSLTPIYNCSLYADQNMMDSGLETIGVHIPKDKITALQQKLRTDTLVTTDDLDTILVDVNASIPAIRKRQNEWNGIGHIYYLMIYTSDISYTNRQMLYNILKMSDAQIDEEDLVINLLSLSKSQEEIDQVFASYGIDLPKEKIQKVQQELQSENISYLSTCVSDLKISGTDNSSFPIEKRILIETWNKSFIYQYLYRFTDGILTVNLAKLYEALQSQVTLNNTLVQNYIDHLERDSHTGFVLPRNLIKRVQAKLQSQQKITEEDLKSIYIDEPKALSRESLNIKVWNGMGALIYLLEFTDNISEVNRIELLRLLNSATPPLFKIAFKDFSEQYKLAWLRYLSPDKWARILENFEIRRLEYRMMVLYKKLMEDEDLSTFRDSLLGNLKDTDDDCVAYLRMYDCSRDWSEKDAYKIRHMRWNKFKSEYGAKQNHKDRIKAYEEKYGTIIKKNLEKMKSDPSFRKEWEVIRNMLSYLVLNKETILPKRVHFMKNHLCLDLD